MFHYFFLVKMQHKETIVSQNAFNVLEDIAYTIECMSDEKENDDSCEQQIKTINKDLAKKIHQLDEGSTNFVCILNSIILHTNCKYFRNRIRLLSNSFKF